MKQNGTYHDLMLKVNELNNFTQMFPTVAQMIQGHIESFRRNNGHAIKKMRELMEPLYDKYCLKENGEFVVSSNGEPEFISAQHANDFNQEKEIIMGTPVIIVI